MDIPKLQTNPDLSTTTVKNGLSLSSKKLPLYVIVVSLSLVIGFFLSRFFPGLSPFSANSSTSSAGQSVTLTQQATTEDIKPGVLYGQTGQDFSDTASGIIRSGTINGVGTHILERQGGKTQWASLTSSAVDLDLFIDKTVEVNGQTNASNKTSWLLDVGTIKIIE